MSTEYEELFQHHSDLLERRLKLDALYERVVAASQEVEQEMMRVETALSEFPDSPFLRPTPRPRS